MRGNKKGICISLYIIYIPMQTPYHSLLILESPAIDIANPLISDIAGIIQASICSGKRTFDCKFLITITSHSLHPFICRCVIKPVFLWIRCIKDSSIIISPSKIRILFHTVFQCVGIYITNPFPIIIGRPVRGTFFIHIFSC